MEPPVDDAKAPKKDCLLEVVLYYPNPYWQNTDWVKNLIIFFDEIATLVSNLCHFRLQQ